MLAVVTPEKINLPPGTVMKFPGTWQNYYEPVLVLGLKSTQYCAKS